MITADNFVKRWKGSDLSTLSSDSFVNKYISQESQYFLVNAGLPIETFFDAEFSFDLSEKALKFLDKDMNEVSQDSNSKYYLKIGTQLSSLICIELNNGKIIILRTRIKKIEYVSSGVLELAELIIIFDEIYDKFRENEINRKNKKEVKAAADYLKDEANRIDPKAISAETVWNEMIEVVESMN